MIRVFEAFAGVGTQAMALKRIGIDYKVVGISEIDKFALKSYEEIHGKVNNYGDISKIDSDNLPDFDLFTYSFPCQDISMAGKQAGFNKDSGTRSSLLWECERIIRNKKPKYLLMENVKALTFKKNIEGFNNWLKILEDLGYKNHWKVLNAKDYGIPQNRERVFCISILDDEKEYKFPKKQILKTRLKDVLEDEVDEKYYLSNDRVKQLIKIIRNDDIKEKSIYDGSIKNPKSKNIANCLTGRDRGIVNFQSSGNVVVEPKIIQTHKLKSDKRYNPSRFRVYSPKGIGPTLLANAGSGNRPCIPIKNGTKNGYINAYPGDGVDLINPNGKTRRGRVQKESIQTLTCGDNRGVVADDLRIRKLTPLEYWRLMGIDDEDFYKAQKVNSNSQLYKQAGNAIVVDVLAAIFMELFKESR
ncbi:DNA cytosine methyltransferase [uncultured Peptoniphilus sp.]|uniref:DNA cytosine methyltransferase n=1 Tax=uncultured Peptoniphilus sp. TaxID=254354 RepID=UPI0025959E25|nr:DNA cytosine methyltransferase [uncultured Peptoniphilus sp.]